MGLIHTYPINMRVHNQGRRKKRTRSGMEHEKPLFFLRTNYPPERGDIYIHHVYIIYVWKPMKTLVSKIDLRLMGYPYQYLNLKLRASMWNFGVLGRTKLLAPQFSHQNSRSRFMMICVHPASTDDPHRWHAQAGVV